MAPPLWEEHALTCLRKKMQLLPRPILAVNAVAQATIPQRQYPLGALALALGELLRQGTVNSCVLLGDHHSRREHGPLRAVLGPRGLDLAGEVSLAAGGALLRECDAVLTIDGGLLHLALATPLPVLALYGPTEIYSRDPRGLTGRYRVLSGYSRCRCECLSHRGIRVRAECRREPQCLAAIPPERIVAAVTELLALAGTGGQGQERQR
jgi:ADP-heptose:LPS heptosyltransferase